jgi:thiol-disulfide isomerase/thioredoxin
LGVADPEKPNASVEVTLHRLVEVRGSYRFQIEDVRMDWTYTKALVPQTDERLIVCGSFGRDFVMKLPPGAFVLEAHGEVVECMTEKVRKNITLSRADGRVDVGVLELAPGFAIESRLAGKWANLADYYGKEPPEWQIADARGVPKSVDVADFRGKWLLIEFWSPFCLPCITKNLPELARFYEEHGNERERFEIVAFCCDPETDDVDELYHRLRAAVKKAWKGKPLPFPLLLDSERRTEQNYGISIFPTTLLVDPEGRLVEGGSLQMLEKKLTGTDDESR